MSQPSENDINQVMELTSQRRDIAVGMLRKYKTVEEVLNVWFGGNPGAVTTVSQGPSQAAVGTENDSDIQKAIAASMETAQSKSIT